METGAPVVLAACPRADDVFTVYKNALTKQVYRALRVPLPVVRGIGPTLLPRPIPLTHFLSAPIEPPTTGGEKALERYHRHLTGEMNMLMQR